MCVFGITSLGQNSNSLKSRQAVEEHVAGDTLPGAEELGGDKTAIELFRTAVRTFETTIRAILDETSTSAREFR
jgi:hypothetical protein